VCYWGVRKDTDEMAGGDMGVEGVRERCRESPENLEIGDSSLSSVFGIVKGGHGR